MTTRPITLKMGEGLAYESVELRRRRRLPLKKRLSLLPNLGLIGGPVFLVLLIIMFLLNSPRESRGIYVRLTQRGWGPDENCLAGPIVVTINQHGSLSRLLLNGTEVSREEFERALKSKLAERADWEVFVDGDDSVSFADPLYAIDIVNDLHAKAVILTPKLRNKSLKRAAHQSNCREKVKAQTTGSGSVCCFCGQPSTGSYSGRVPAVGLLLKACVSHCSRACVRAACLGHRTLP